MDSPYVQDGSAKLCAGCVTSPADLEPPKGLGLGLGPGSGWSWPTRKVEVDETCPALVFVPTRPAHSAMPSKCVASKEGMQKQTSREKETDRDGGGP